MLDFRDLLDGVDVTNQNLSFSRPPPPGSVPFRLGRSRSQFQSRSFGFGFTDARGRPSRGDG
eukprot:9001-Pelagococcus_subviridis.AAC.1